MLRPDRLKAKGSESRKMKLVSVTLALSLSATSAFSSPSIASEPSSNEVATVERALKLPCALTDADADSIVDSLPDPAASWIPFLVKFLREEQTTKTEFLSIDVDDVSSVDKMLGDQIEALQYDIDNPKWLVNVAQQDPAEVYGPQKAPSHQAAGAGDASDAAVGSEGAGTSAGVSSEETGAAQEQAASSQGSEPAAAISNPVTVSHDLTTQKFIAVIGEQARAAAQDSDLFASVMIAQAILESGSGNSTLSKAPYNNLFGIKGSYKGSSVTMSTLEDDGTGAHYRIDASFRSYPTMKESLSDYVDLLSSPMYQGARKSKALTPANACGFLQGLYATDTSYAQKLMAFIEEYDLERYDEPLDYELVRTYDVKAGGKTASEGAQGLSGSVALIEHRDLTDLVAEATSHLGEPYVWGGTTPGSFDCSGLVQYCYEKAMGVSIPRVAQDQYGVGQEVEAEDLHMGDLLFFQSAGGTIDHVAMYLGEGCYIEAPHTGDVVKVTSFDEKAPNYAKRVLPTRPKDASGTANAKFGGEYESALSRLSRNHYDAGLAEEGKVLPDTYVSVSSVYQAKASLLYSY